MKYLIHTTILLLTGLCMAQPSLVNSDQLDLKVDDSQISTTGGANKVLQYDNVGNLVLAPLRTLADVGSLVPNGGNLILTDRQSIHWMAADGGSSGTNGGLTNAGKRLFSITQDNSHPNETYLVGAGNISFVWGESTSQKAMQFGWAVGGDQYIYHHSGPASAGVTKRQALPNAYYNHTWTGGVNTWNQSVVQVAPLDTSGTNSAWKYYFNVAGTPVQDMEGAGYVASAEIAPAGIWSAGTAPAPNTLTGVGTAPAVFTQTCSKYKTVQFAKMALGATNTLAISGALTGMRGVIYVTQEATGPRALTMPSGSALPSDWALSSLGNKIDRLEWDFDGTFYYWTIKAGLNVPLDSDASTFLTNAVITDDTQRTAINNLTLALKASGSSPNTLWEKTYRLFPFVGNDATKHRYELKTASAAGTFSATGITHSANGISGDGVNGYMRTGFVPSASAAQNDIGIFVYNRTTLPTDAGAFINGYGTGGVQVGIERTTTALRKQGLNNADSSQVISQSSDFRGLLFAVRSGASSEAWGKVGGTEATGTVTSTANCDAQLVLFGRYYYSGSDTYDHPSNANLAAAIITKSLDATERAALKAIIDTFQTALGRQNP